MTIHQNHQTQAPVKFNPFARFTGLTLIAIGFGLWVAKIFSHEYVDDAGMLHEKFYLIPMGFLAVFLGVVVLAAAATIYWIKKQKHAHKHA